MYSTDSLSFIVIAATLLKFWKAEGAEAAPHQAQEWKKKSKANEFKISMSDLA